MVDNLGIEPSRRCVQDSAAHLRVALTTARSARRRYRRANARSRTWTGRLRGGCTTIVLRRRALEAIRTPTVGLLKTVPPASWATRAEIPRVDSNHAFGVQSAVSCRIDDGGEGR